MFSSVQSLSHVRLFATPWTAACQASLSITNSQSLLKLMSIESVMSSISSSANPFSRLQSFPVSGSFPMSQFFASGGQSTGASPSASVLPWIFRTDFLRMDWLDLLAVQGSLKRLLQQRSSKASIWHQGNENQNRSKTPPFSYSDDKRNKTLNIDNGDHPALGTGWWASNGNSHTCSWECKTVQ